MRRELRRVLSERGYHCGDIAAARQHLETAIAIAVDEGNHHLHALCVLALAQLLCAVGRLGEADERLDEVMSGPVRSDVFIDVWAHSERARILIERGEYRGARECNARVRDLSDSGTDLFVQFQAHADLARIERARGQPRRGRRAHPRDRGAEPGPRKCVWGPVSRCRQSRPRARSAAIMPQPASMSNRPSRRPSRVPTWSFDATCCVSSATPNSPSTVPATQRQRFSS